MTGVLSVYALLLASGNPLVFQDWNNDAGEPMEIDGGVAVVKTPHL